MTPARIESIVNLFTKKGGAIVSEVPGRYHFHIKIPFGDLIWPAEMKEAVEEAKPAHLGFDVALKWGRLFLLNAAGGVEKEEIPATKWTEKKPYIVFDIGLNNSGIVETVSATKTTRQQHHSYSFAAGTINGRLRLNEAGNYAREKKNLGGNVTERWKVFTGSRLNSRASPRLNEAATETQSKTYHRADWKEVINRHGRALNAAGGGIKKIWTTETKETHVEKRFKAPGYALNRFGTVTKSWKDVGHDEQISDVLFARNTLNGGQPKEQQQQHSKTVTKTWTIFSGRTLNSKRPATLNSSEPVQKQSSTTRSWTERIVTYTGSTLNGSLRTNSGKPGKTTRTVHIPVWRNVITRHGATVLNASSHTTKTLEITHTVPGRTENRFSHRGTLLNGKAVMGYLTI